MKYFHLNYLFLSTPSARRATCGSMVLSSTILISIHALREEGDVVPLDAQPVYLLFLSTPSARRATAAALPPWAACRISIHALREEGDSLPKAVVKDREEFLSTPSARRATPYRFVDVSRWQDFYPRPPRGGRPPTPKLLSRRRYFYPRPPRGGRPSSAGRLPILQTISIHALREEGDGIRFLLVLVDIDISIHALREEGDPLSGVASKVC